MCDKMYDIVVSVSYINYAPRPLAEAPTSTGRNWLMFVLKTGHTCLGKLFRPVSIIASCKCPLSRNVTASAFTQSPAG